MDTAKVSAQIDMLLDETERLANRPAWVPFAQGALFALVMLLVARGFIAIL